MDNGKSKRITKKIKAYGIVQGVGFRPLVYRIAKKLNINGTVRNVGGYVEIILAADELSINLFLEELKEGNKDSGYEIVKLELEEQPLKDYSEFVIINSRESEEVSIIPPDLPVCESCRKELFDKADRRYQNPFISCMSCGPRYTILEDIPYDRHTTTMKDFEMCTSCMEEYTSPGDRRFHAQTISCNDCGPYLIFRENKIRRSSGNKHTGQKQDNRHRIETSENELLENDALTRAVSILRSGGIIAVKGIGGYHLVCSPFIEETVQNLRKLKGREEKPFAVMFENISEIEEYCVVSLEEKSLLDTKAKPIVLLYMHRNTMAPSTNKGSIYCGAFLPYTPLQLLLIKECGPLIMTSANLSDQTIIRLDEAMLSLQSHYLNGVLYNTRRIVRSVDDSVAKVIDGKPQLIRRSRGYVPYPVFIEARPTESIEKDSNRSSGRKIDKSASAKEPVVFAAGGDLKAAFCLYKNSSAVVSQYFGDLEEASVMEEYKNAYSDLSRLLKMEPTLAACDLHPNYYSSEYAKTLGLPVVTVQHHHAHIASVMAEHDLQGKVIGIAFDGTGYGTDGNVWGGEFLICEGAEFIRAGQLKYTPMLGGDESMRDALKTATCFLIDSGLMEYVQDDRSRIIQAALKHRVNTVLSSSMGRLFDAVASILNIQQVNRYEGECAAFFEREAVLASREGKEPVQLSFAIREESEIIELEPRPVLEALCSLRATEDIGSLALGFHYALAEAIGRICAMLRDKYQSNTVALSGGVFQNTILTEQTLKLLREKGFQVYVNLAVPPNDGAISLGQTYVALRYSETLN